MSGSVTTNDSGHGTQGTGTFAPFLKGSRINPVHVKRISEAGKKKRDWQLAEYTEIRDDKRIVKVDVPFDGHWRFIVQCAVLARVGLHVKDIKVPAWELADALNEARCYIAERQVRANIDRGKDSYNARDIHNLKTTFGL